MFLRDGPRNGPNRSAATVMNVARHRELVRWGTMEQGGGGTILSDRCCGQAWS